MVKTQEQAVAIQRRRFESGKKGVSRAVRRYFMRQAGGNPGKAYHLTWTTLLDIRNFDGCRRFDECKERNP